MDWEINMDWANTFLSALQSMGGYGNVPAPTASMSRQAPASRLSKGSTPGGWGDYFSRDSMFGTTNNKTGISTNGWVGGAVEGVQAIGDMYSSMKQFGLAEDQFDESKRQYNQNYQAQVKNYNTDLEDRQRARVASNPTGYQSVAEYMTKHRQV